MYRKYFQFFLHVLSCIAFLIFATLLEPGPEMSFESLTSLHTLRDIASFVLIIIFFYINFYVLIPRFYFAKKFNKYILFCALFFASVVVIPRAIFFSERDHIEEHGRFQPRMLNENLQEGFPSAQHYDHHKSFLGFDLHHLFFEMTQIFSLFLVVILFSLIIQIRNQLRRTEQEKLNAELSYFKAQINPHFLFNTLNSIYSLAIEKSDYTPTAIVKLSGMMRYVITESSADFVSLEKEINYIRDFVDLQKLRLGDTAEIRFDIESEYFENRIAPLILIAFIENAFKHGVNPDEKSLIVIELRITGKFLFLLVKNKKVNLIPNADLSNRVGLENTVNRLALVYASKYTLKFSDLKDEYRVELKIELI